MKSETPLQRTNEMQKKLDSLYWNTPTICIIRDERERAWRSIRLLYFSLAFLQPASLPG